MLLAVAPVGLGLCDTQRMERGKRVGLRAQAATCSRVFGKALAVDANAPHFKVGEAVNLMATDARTLCRLFTFGHQLWAAPLQTAIAVAGLCWLVGWAAIAGVVVVAASMRATAELTKRIKGRQRLMERVRDRRLGLLSEYVQGIRVVKVFAWEADVRSRVGALRRDELGHLAWKLFYRAWFKVFRNVGTVVGFAAFATAKARWYAGLAGEKSGRRSGTTEGFTALVLFATLRSGLAIWPQVIQIYVQASVGWERLVAFLDQADVDDRRVRRDGVAPGTCALTLDGGGAAAWGDAAVLRGAAAFVAAPRGLTCVYGPTASGKSTLLHALFGEVPLHGGVADLGGSVALVPQRPWITNATLRDNVLFGSPMVRARYDAVLDACCLGDDQGSKSVREVANFKGSYFGRFPLVSADLSTSDHLSERCRT